MTRDYIRSNSAADNAFGKLDVSLGAKYCGRENIRGEILLLLLLKNNDNRKRLTGGKRRRRASCAQ